MNIGIVGLGLIGGSLAKSAKKNTNFKVYGYDLNKEVIKKAVSENSIDGELTQKRLQSCDYVFNHLLFLLICLYLFNRYD